ncbi:hypothetical protein HPULCUR_006723 [Helicostylum pulchrum]|uniref:HECT-type E3 ubiquitin transferase n=1 Tax=Helicostylum pulchrum TaxID=562976 RepID=A0ABP9Y4P0_9FUNG
MEQKSNKLKRNKKDSSKPAERYSLRNKKESVNKPHTRSEKRKIEKEQQELNNKKTKMDTKGKQKAGESSVTPTTTATTTKSITASTKEKEENKPVDTSLDYYNNDGEEDDDEEEEVMHDDWDEPKEDEEDNEPEEEEDEEDEDEEDEELSNMRRTLGLQMQGLFGGIMSSDSSRFRSILASLKNQEDSTMQLIALQELAEILSVSSEDNLAGYFSSDNFCKELVRIMKGPEEMIPMTEDMDEDMMLALAMSEGFSGPNPEVMLLACRCISNLLEAMPTAVTSVVFHGAIGVLCQKLKSIQYIDLAEQALYALEKISAQLPRAVVHEGGLSAVMMYFDFFSIHAQRTALRTASNCMRGIDQDSFSQVMEITPTLMNTISYSDRSVVELTCHCWVRISESYRNQRESLERVITVDLLKVLFGLIPISGNSNAVHAGTFQDLLRIFRSISKASPQLSFELLKLGLIDAFYQILTGASTVPSTLDNEKPIHITLDTKWRDSVPTIMKTIVDLLPPLPKDDMFNSRRFKEGGLRRPSETDSTLDPRVQWFQNDPQVLLKMDTVLIPLILDMYASTVNLRVRQLVTHTLVKLIHYSDTDTLSKVLKNVSLSSFLSGILTRQEHPALLIDALYQTELMIKKLPEIYHFLFEREGVLYEIENISKLPFVADEDQPLEKKSAAPQQDDNTTVDESDGTTTDAEKRDGKKEEDESDEDEEDSKKENKSGEESGGPSSSDFRSAHRRLLDRGDLQALLRSRYDFLQQQQQKLNRHQSAEAEKGVGKNSTRKYIIQLAQYFVENYAEKKSVDGTCVPAGGSLKEIIDFTNNILSPTDDDDPASEKTLQRLSVYLRDSIMGISSFELINSGLMKALLAYLTKEEGQFKASLKDRTQLFESIFVDQPDIDQNGNNALKKLVVRLQEILSRSEAFEVVTPLESSSNESLRNPTSMLAKQLRLRLTGAGEDIPNAYKQLMVSTHAVATFRVLEEYLLARISASSAVCDMEDDEEEDDEEEEEHVLIDEGKDEMDIDAQENEDVEMAEAVVVKKDETEEEEVEKTSASSSKKKEGEWKIQFSLHGSVIPNDSTVYAAVHQYEMNPENEHRKGRNFWSTSYPITYERIWVSATEITEAEAKKSSATPVRQLANVVRPKELQDDSTCNQVIDLLKALSPAIAKRPNGITSQDFINRKLTAKMNRQLEEPLIVASSCLPTWTYWLMHIAPFLFPFETRYLFIQSTSFGYSRLIARWQSLQMRNNTQNGPRNDLEQQPTLGRMERQKVRIVRSQMLESAIKILDLFGSSPTVLEIEYMDEEGTGMGPTLEFYASTSKEFSKHSLNMWRGSQKSEKGYVESVNGLFPKTLAKSGSKSTKKIVHLFKTLGQFIAKGLLDFRIIDIPFSPAFFKVALDNVKPTPELLMEIDPVLAKSVNTLQSFIEKKRQINNDSTTSNEEKAKAIKDIRVDDASLDDLCLDFTLPGDPSYELKTGGTEIAVTINNVDEYIELLQDSIAGSGIAQQVTAFRQGFNRLFAIDDLKLLTHLELVSLFGKAEEDWSLATLSDTIRADHGFTMESNPVRYLLQILSEMEATERRQFLQFTTGSPRLPIGGWKALRPVFTVVRKIPEEPLTADDYLPSVMTCANYFKMPAYTTKEIMKARLLTSMREGQNSFLLS